MDSVSETRSLSLSSDQIMFAGEIQLSNRQTSTQREHDKNVNVFLRGTKGKRLVIFSSATI